MSFWGELKRRNVFKVGAAYVIVAWLIVQVANTFFPLLNFPKWAVPMVAVLVILGFPLALIHAWAYEVTPNGIKKTKDVPLAESITNLTGKKLDYILGGLLVIAVAYILFDDFYLDRRAIQTEVATRVAELALPAVGEEDALKTIAVLPFTDLSPEKDQEYFADGMSEEILNGLAQIPDLTVIARTSSFIFKGSDKKIQEIASELGVAHILEGSVRKAGNALRITAQLVKAVDGSHLWSKTYDKEFKVEEMFSVQEDIAKAVANELKVTLGVTESIKQLGGTDNIEAYNLYLLAGGQGLEGESILALKNIDAAIALDPEFALAWAMKASTHLSISRGRFADLYDPQLEEAERAVMKAIEIEPDLASAYEQLGEIRLTQGEFLAAASAFRKESELSNSPTGAIFDNAHLLQDVGYIHMAHKIMAEDRRTDPIDETVRAEYVHDLAFIGDMRGAEKEYESGKAMFGGGWFLGNILMTFARLGSGQAVSRDDILIPSPVNGAAIEHLDAPKDGLAELHRFYNDTDQQGLENLTWIAYWAAYFGDPELSMSAIEKVIDIDAENIKHYWQPLFKEVRQLPRYKDLVKRIGLVEVWERFGWPDLCRPTDDVDFECD